MAEPQKLTVIMLADHPPRIWTGWIEDDGIEAYIGGLMPQPIGTQIRFSHMEVYSDIGQSVLNRTFRHDPDNWNEIK